MLIIWFSSLYRITVNYSTMNESVPRVPTNVFTISAGPSGTGIFMLHRWDKSPDG